MVLTQHVVLNYLRTCALLVSIPLWFSRNYIGSTEWQPVRLVSIPLWFSRNRQQRPKRHHIFRFHTTMVLTQRSTHCNSRRVYSRFPYHYGSHATVYLNGKLDAVHVSIPLWFSRNWASLIEVAQLVPSFHTTMVLTQPTLGTKPILVSQKFPYHYGSHATT